MTDEVRPAPAPEVCQTLVPTLQLPGCVITLSPEMQTALAIRAGVIAPVREATALFVREYERLGGLKAVIGSLPDAAMALLMPQVKGIVTRLVEQDIDTYNQAAFLEHFHDVGGLDPFFGAFQEVISAYEAITEDEATRDAIRAQRQDDRFRVVGGGFGLGGAAKGIATAGAINMGTAAVVGTFNLLGKMASSIANMSKESAIYRESKDGLAAGFYEANLNLYRLFHLVLEEEKGVEVPGLDYLDERAEKAEAIFANLQQLDGLSLERQLGMLAKCIEHDPTRLVYYDVLMALYADRHENVIAIAGFGAQFEPTVAVAPAFVEANLLELVRLLERRDAAGIRQLLASLVDAHPDLPVRLGNSLEDLIVDPAWPGGAEAALATARFVIEQTLFTAPKLEALRDAADKAGLLQAWKAACDGGSDDERLQLLGQMNARPAAFSPDELGKLVTTHLVIESAKATCDERQAQDPAAVRQRQLAFARRVRADLALDTPALTGFIENLEVQGYVEPIATALQGGETDRAFALFEEARARLAPAQLLQVGVTIGVRFEDTIKQAPLEQKEAVYRFVRDAGTADAKTLRFYESVVTKARKGGKGTTGNLVAPTMPGPGGSALPASEVATGLFVRALLEGWEQGNPARFAQVRDAWRYRQNPLVLGVYLALAVPAVLAGLALVATVLVLTATGADPKSSGSGGMVLLVVLGTFGVACWRAFQARARGKSAFESVYHDGDALPVLPADAKTVARAAAFKMRGNGAHYLRYAALGVPLVAVPGAGPFLLLGALVMAMGVRIQQLKAYRQLIAAAGTASAVVPQAAAEPASTAATGAEAT